LQFGLRNAIDMPTRFVPCLLLIPTFASACGFMFACKHQLSAMSESGLMPAFLQVRVGRNHIPRFALTACLLVQYSVYLTIFYCQLDVKETYRFCCIAGCCMYILLLASFVHFRVQFANLERQFVNPLGVFGGVLGILIFAYLLVGLVVFQSVNATSRGSYMVPVAFVVFMLCMLIYYEVYVRDRQFFSDEEQTKFLKVYIMNVNHARKNASRMRRARLFSRDASKDNSYNSRNSTNSRVATITQRDSTSATMAAKLYVQPETVEAMYEIDSDVDVDAQEKCDDDKVHDFN